MFEFQDHLEWQDIYRYADQAGCDIAQFDEDLHHRGSCTAWRMMRRTPR